MLPLNCLILLLIVGSSCTQDGRQIVFTKLNCTSDTKYWNLTITLNEKTLSGINVVNLPTSGLTTNIYLYVNANGQDGEYQPFFTKHLDACKLLENPMYDPLINLGLQIVFLNKDNHVFRKCPIEVGTYWVKNFTVPGHQLPLMIPNVKFYVMVEVYHLAPERKLLLGVRVDARVENIIKRRIKSRTRN